VSLSPQHAYGWLNLAELRLKQGRHEDALRTMRDVARLIGDDPKLLNTGGAILARLGQLDEAVSWFQRALRIDPDMAAAYGNLAGAYMMLKRPTDALAAYREALKRNPHDVAMVRRAAWIMATQPAGTARNRDEALQMAAWANQQAGGKSAIFLQTLAAALANVGRFDEAVHVQQTALDAAVQAAGVTEQTLEEYRAQLAAYEQGNPWRE
jgi:tetratricopeptide (TPR) repeat protein